MHLLCILHHTPERKKIERREIGCYYLKVQSRDMFLLYKERKKFMEKAIDSWQAMASVYLAYRFP